MRLLQCGSERSTHLKANSATPSACPHKKRDSIEVRQSSIWKDRAGLQQRGASNRVPVAAGPATPPEVESLQMLSSDRHYPAAPIPRLKRIREDRRSSLQVWRN